MKPVLKPSDHKYFGNHNQKHRHDRLSIKPFLNSVTDGQTDAWTDRRACRNSAVDILKIF